MQKQKKQFVIALILLILCAAALLGVKLYNQKQEEKKDAEAEASKIVVTDLNTDDITAFSYQLNGETLSFTKEGDSWIYDGDAGIDIDEDIIDTMLNKVTAITAEEEISEYEELSDYGLDQPSNTITLTTASGVTTLYLGNENEILSQYYLKISDSDIVYLVNASINGHFEKTIDDLRAEEESETEEEADTTESADVTDAAAETETTGVTEAIETETVETTEE